MKIYFHEITNSTWSKILLSNAGWTQLNEIYKKPDWCNHPRALASTGCPKLISRKVISIDSCRNCRMCAKRTT